MREELASQKRSQALEGVSGGSRPASMSLGRVNGRPVSVRKKKAFQPLAQQKADEDAVVTTNPFLTDLTSQV